MARRLLVTVLAATVIAVQAGGQLGHAAAPATAAEVFWRAVLPDSPLPGAILRLIRPAADKDYNRPSDDDFGYDDYRKDPSKRISAAGTTRAHDPRPPFNYGYEGSAKRTGGAAAGAREFDYDDYVGAEKPRGAAAVEPPFNYAYKAPIKSRAGERRRATVGEPPFQQYAYSAQSKSLAGERRRATVGEPPFQQYAYSAQSKRLAGERRRATVGEPPFNYAYKSSRKSDAAERHRASVGEPPFQQYAYSTPSKSLAGERRGVTTGEPPFNYAYKGSRKSDAAERRGGATTGQLAPFGYDYKAPSRGHAESRASDGESMAPGGEAATTTVFFHEEAMRVGERLPFHFPPAVATALGFLPRHVADSVPFTTPALRGVLALFGVSPDSDMAASMEYTLSTCESPALDGESKFCATSLEALVERAMDVLGTRDVRPLTSTLPRAGAPLQTYTVRAVRPVEGGPSFLACHDETYPYTVYRCHTTGPARAYMVEMEGARGNAVTVATVCHTDTSRWNPEHVSFKFLGTKPGGEPVCHLMPYGHIIWAKNVKRSPA